MAVDVPRPDRDSPGWAKVGVIAAIGFVIGIAWPRLVGVKLGPSAPGEAAAAAAASASAAKAAGHAPDAPPASVTTVTGKTAAPAGSGASSGNAASSGAAAAASGPPQVNVQRGNVLTCKTADGESRKGKDCGSLPGLDNVVPPHLRKLATCTAAEGQTGKLSFIATASFPSGGLSWDVGKSSTVGNLEGISNCLKTHFSGVTANGVAHEHNRYTVAYTMTFAPPAAEAASAKIDKADKAEADKNAKDDRSEKAESPPASGEATVGWEVALVRDVPKTGQVVARLPRGSKVKVGAIKDGWYAVKFGDGFATDGFVYRGAIGR